MPTISKLLEALRIYSAHPEIPATSMKDLVGETVPHDANVLHYLVKNIFSSPSLNQEEKESANYWLKVALSKRHPAVLDSCKLPSSEGQFMADLLVENFPNFNVGNVKQIIALSENRNLTHYHPQQVAPRLRSSSASRLDSFLPVRTESKETLPGLLLKKYSSNPTLVVDVFDVLTDLFIRGVRPEIDDEVANRILFNPHQYADQTHSFFIAINESLLLPPNHNANFFFHAVEYCSKCSDPALVKKINGHLMDELGYMLRRRRDGTYPINDIKGTNGESVIAFLLRNQTSNKVARNLWDELQKSENLEKFDIELFEHTGKHGGLLHQLIASTNANFFDKFFVKKITQVDDLELRARILNMRDSQGRTPLHLAAEKGWDHAIQSLLQLGADPTLLDAQYNTPLLTAIDVGGFVNSCQHLLAFPNVDIEAQNAQVRPLYRAIERNSETLAQVLLDHKADPDSLSESEEGMQTPLQKAIEKNNYLSVTLLVKYGANIYNERGEYNSEYAKFKSGLSEENANELSKSEYVGRVMKSAREGGKYTTLESAQRIASPRMQEAERRMLQEIGLPYSRSAHQFRPTAAIPLSPEQLRRLSLRGSHEL